MGERAVVSEPAAVRRIFLDNVANYRKDALQLRVLAPGLGRGLLTADGEDWRAQRRALAPLFSPRQIPSFAPAMDRVAAAAVERLAPRGEGRVLDVSQQMARVTLEVLEQTLFSQGLGRDPGEFQRAVSRYFDTIGRIDPLDLIGAPQFLPRFGRMRGRATLDFFARAVDDIIGARKALLASGAAAPHDILTLLLGARDPDTGEGLSEDDVRANIVTFIGAGHETTANALTWTLYLLSQAPDWRERVEAEIDAHFDPANPAALGRRAAGDQSGDRGDAEALPAGGDAEPRGDRSRHAGRPPYPRRHGGHRLAVPAAPASHLVEGPGRVRSQSLPRRQSRRHRPLRLYPVRRGAARVHRHGLCDAGDDDRARPSPARAAVRTRPRSCRLAGRPRDAAAGRRNEDDCAPTAAGLRKNQV